MKVLISEFKQDEPQKIEVQIDPSDTWSMDHTLAHIVAPMLRQLKTTKHGAPIVDNEDVPAEFHWDNANTDIPDGSAFFKRWDWVLDEMIWAFEQLAGDNEPFDPPNYTANTAWNERVRRGTKLFGRYYGALWD